MDDQLNMTFDSEAEEHQYELDWRDRRIQELEDQRTKAIRMIGKLQEQLRYTKGILNIIANKYRNHDSERGRKSWSIIAREIAGLARAAADEIA